MTPENAKARDKAIETLIVASLRAPATEPEVTEEEINRYLDQTVTLSSEDEAALQASRHKLRKTIGRILHGEQEVDKSAPTPAKFEPAVQTRNAKQRRASEEFVEAIVIAQLTRALATPDYPLGRKRCQKLTYLSHRKAQEDVTQHFLKKAAGPYSPWARYQGPETIAVKNGYVQRAKVGVFAGFVAGSSVEKIDEYLSRYPVCTAVDWVITAFRWRKNDDLELLATVDFAALDLKKTQTPITLETVRQIIEGNEEWKPKLTRAAFAGDNIQRALVELQTLFPTTYAV